MDLHLDRTFKYYWLMFKRHDLSAGLTVFQFALPLCLGVALASELHFYSGILSEIIGWNCPVSPWFRFSGFWSSLLV